MPSSRRRPGSPLDSFGRPPSSRRPGSSRGVTRRERHDLISDPPEHQSSDSLDSIGLESSGRLAARRTSRRGSERTSGGTARSKRQRAEWARAKVRKLTPLLALIGLVFAGVLAALVPGVVRKKRIGRLYSSDPLVRETAAIQLGVKSSGLNSLTAAMETAPFDGAGGAAALAMSMMGEAGSARLQKLAESSAPAARQAAAFGLGLTRRPGAVEPLAKLLADDEAPVRVEAAKALGMIRAPGAVKALVAAAECPIDARDAVLLGVLTAACPEAQAELVQGLSASTPAMRQAAGQALISLGLVPSDSEIKALVESKDSAVRAGGLEFLGLTGGPLFEPSVTEALGDKSAAVRKSAVRSIALRAWDQGAGKLEAMLAGDEPADVKLAAAEALGRIARLESAQPLAKAVVSADLGAEVRAAAAAALAAIGARFPGYILKQKLEANKITGDLLTHLELAAARPDPRWAALETLVGGCEAFDERLAPAAFAAMNALARCKLAPKAEVWQRWMARKIEEGKTLGRIAYTYAQGAALYEEGKTAGDREKKNRAVAMIEETQEAARELRDRAEPEDKDFFRQLYGLLCGRTNAKPKPEPQAPPAEAPAPAPAAEPPAEPAPAAAPAPAPAGP